MMESRDRDPTSMTTKVATKGAAQVRDLTAKMATKGVAQVRGMTAKMAARGAAQLKSLTTRDHKVSRIEREMINSLARNEEDRCRSQRVETEVESRRDSENFELSD